jgi:hypothetical protein
MPDSIRHPEGFDGAGFRLKSIPVKTGAGMTTLIEAAMSKRDYLDYVKK